MDIADVRFVYDLEKETFGKSLEKPMLYKEILYNDMAHYFVVMDDDTRVGYIGLWLTRPNAEIINLAVVPLKRNKGYGKALMEETIAFCAREGVDTLTLEAKATNMKLIGFYEHLGFEKISVRKKYYSDGTNALLMAREIGGKS